jgi:pyruvate/2-oxoglutarate dehydrogenase complex dihydrolipoamide dehydrogenase (E3) component
MDPDVIIIGSGQTATPLAAKLAADGKRVVVIESGALGGTCVNNGCTPTKTMIASARVAHVARTAGRLGVRTSEVVVDFAAVVERKNAMVLRWRQGVERRLATGGDRIAVLRGRGRFVGPRTVEVNGQQLRAPVVVVNVGARPAVPRLPGLEAVPHLDSSSLLERRALPAHLLVLGPGYIGCELGQMFRRFGSAVTLVGRQPHLLPREDVEVSTALEGVFRNEGIDLRLGVAVERVERAGPGGEGVALRLLGGAEVRGSDLLVATGRVPNTDGLGCETAGIRLDDQGRVLVDDHYRTSAEGVYAVGDVIPGPQFTHTSWDDHRRLIAILRGRAPEGRPAGRAGTIVPSCVFTDPQVASVGLSEREARDRGIAHEVATMPWGQIARAIETDEPAGLLKVLIDPASERILGARLVGADAGELIHVFLALMLAGAPARALVDGQMVHPAFAEGLQSVLMTLPRFG